jgi:thiamine biosynthesis lipoprotein
MAWSAEPYIFEAIGTTWQIDLPDGFLVSKKEALIKKILERIEIFDRNYSRFRSDSLVTEMSKQVGVYTLPDDAELLFSLYENLYRLTKGAVTPLIGSALVEAGYDPSYSLEAKEIKPVLRWENVLKRNALSLEVTHPVMLDFGAAGKGYLIDIVSDILRKEKIENFCVDAGGDMIYDSTQDFLKVGLEHPQDQKKIIGVASIKNQSICGSAGNRRQWGEFHHIINPHTLISPQDVLAVWVIAPTALLADGLTTALFFTESHILQQEYTFEYLLMRSDQSIIKSDNFPAEFFY